MAPQDGSSLHPFDACCMVGRHLKLREGGLYSAEHLLAEMDHYGIAEALVLDSLSREHHPADGNRRIIDVASFSPRLYPVWSALPVHGHDEQPDAASFLDTMRENGIRALHLFPRQYRFSLGDWCIDPFLEPLAAAQVPVFITYNEVGPGGWSWDETDWDAVVALCRRWPMLPIIVSEYRIRRAQRMIYRALDLCPNLRIELSGLWLHRAIECMTERWGAGRLIFGSNWPRLGQHVTLATLTCAEISAGDKRRIAGDNLRQLLSWDHPIRPTEVELPPAADEFVGFGRTGVRPASITIWDNHGHLGGYSPHYDLPNCTLDGVVRDLDRFGVEKVCVFSFAGVFADEVFGNDIVAEAVRRYPDRFVGFTLVNPQRGRDAMLRELERGAGMGLRGVKLIPWYQGYPEEGPLIDVVCQWAHDRKQIILNHHWGSAQQVERLVSTYTEACFFTGHSTTAYAEVMRKRGNLYVCSCPLHEPRSCEEVVAAVGADRLMFGSDLEDLPIAWGLGPILFARLTPQEKRMILGGNLRRVLKQYSLEP